MFKLGNYLLPHTGVVVLALALLFLQVNLDLALPDYLSRIVNVGIQQGGVDSPVPRWIGVDHFNDILSKAGSRQEERIVSLYKEDSKCDRYRLTEEGLLLFSEDDDLRNDFLYLFLSLSKGTNEESLIRAGIKAVRQEYEALGIDMMKIQNDYILRIGIIMLALAAASALATVSVGFLAARVSSTVARDLRGDLFRHVEGFSSAEFDTFSTASLITRNTNDITQIQNVIFMTIRLILLAPMMGIGGFVRAMKTAPSMAWIIGVAVLVLLGLSLVMIALALPRFKRMQKLIDNLNRISREQLSGLLVVRAFCRQDFEKERFARANRELTGNNLFIMRAMAAMLPIITLIMNALSVVVIWVGAGKVAASQMPIGDMMALLQYAVLIVTSFLMLTIMIIMLPRAAVSAERVSEVLRTEPTVLDPEHPAVITDKERYRLEFRNVDFSYPGGGERALRDISFTADPGQTTAIIGSTGAGKSTLVNLILRFYDVCEGKILMDGVDIRNLEQDVLRRRIGYVPQNASLFSGTIGSNLRYGDDSAEAERIEDAAETAQLGEMIALREDFYGSSVSQGGRNFSGGQKQRLSIARALVRNADVLIFDDCFSALDNKTDTALRNALRERTGDVITIIVAQRISTVIHAEQILVLDEGRLVGKGNHKELMGSCLTYREIVLSQLSIEETEAV